MRGNHGGGAVDDGHSPRHTAQLFLAKNYNLSQSAVSYDRGVLEETMINLEVFVTRMFDNLRGMLRSILLVPTRSFQQPEAPRPYTRRNSFQDLVRSRLRQPFIMHLCNMFRWMYKQGAMSRTETCWCRVNWGA